MKKIKKIIILSSIFLLGILSITFLSIKNNKVSAAPTIFYTEPSSSDNVYYYISVSRLLDTYNLFSDNEGNVITLTRDSTNSTMYIVNSDTSKVLYSNLFYVVLFQNQINHYVFYSLEFEYPLSTSTITLTELFTVSFTSSTITEIGTYSQGLQFMVSTSTAMTDDEIIGTFYYRFSPTYFNQVFASSAYSDGYGDGYDEGYDDGQEGENAISPFFNILSGIFTSIGAVFSIELIPNVPIGLFFLVPLFFAIVGLILFIWRKNF